METYTCFIIPPLITAETLRMNERALVAMSSVLPPPKKGEMVTVQLRFIVDGLPNENNEYVEWVLVALDGEAFDTKMRKHLEHKYE